MTCPGGRQKEKDALVLNTYTSNTMCAMHVARGTWHLAHTALCNHGSLLLNDCL